MPISDKELADFKNTIERISQSIKSTHIDHEKNPMINFSYKLLAHALDGVSMNIVSLFLTKKDQEERKKFMDSYYEFIEKNKSKE